MTSPPLTPSPAPALAALRLARASAHLANAWESALIGAWAAPAGTYATAAGALGGAAAALSDTAVDTQPAWRHLASATDTLARASAALDSAWPAASAADKLARASADALANAADAVDQAAAYEAPISPTPASVRANTFSAGARYAARLARHTAEALRESHPGHA